MADTDVDGINFSILFYFTYIYLTIRCGVTYSRKDDFYFLAFAVYTLSLVQCTFSLCLTDTNA